MALTPPETATTHPEVRPFRIDVPEEELVDLRRRIVATHWPDRETVTSARLGARLRPLPPRGTSVRFRVLIDGQPPGAARGIDVDEQGNGTVSEQRLYQLIRQPKPIADRRFEIEFLDPGVEAYAFTFV